MALSACSGGGGGSGSVGVTGGPNGPNGNGNTGGGSGGAGGPIDGGQPVTVNDGEIVASFELAAGNVPNFTLRGTLPLPRGLYLGTEPDVPFQIVDQDDVGYPTQVEIVSRYPGAADGVDLVEILAQVERPAQAVAGDRIQYRVLFSPHSAQPHAITSEVQAFLNAPATLLLRTRDVFGHEYTADLYADARAGNSDLRTLRDGEIAQQVRTHDVMLPTTPVSGASGTLSHMMGVHAYVTTYAHEEFFSLDLRIHNGVSGLNTGNPLDDPQDKLYFDGLELRVPAGWTVIGAYANPYFGAAAPEGGYSVTPLITPFVNSDLHVMHQQAQFHRRLVVAKQGFEGRAVAVLREEGLAFCQAGTGPAGNTYFSWNNPDTSRYFPQCTTLPTLDHVGLASIRADLTADFEYRRDQVASGSAGNWPAESAGIGWAHPWLVAYGGMHGGTEIWLYDGVQTAMSGSQDGYRFSQVQHRMYTDRHPTAFFNLNGDASRMAEWTIQGPNGPYMPIWMYDRFMTWITDPFGFTDAPTFQSDAVAAQGRVPVYEDELENWQNLDRQHLVRYTRSPYVLTWLGNDALSKDDLRLQAELFRISYPNIPQDSGGGQTITTGMARSRERVDADPGTGFPIGRGTGWGLNVMNAAYGMADDAWRNEALTWYGDLCDLLEDGQMDCTGIIQSQPFPHLFNAQYRCRQSIEAAILENALFGMRERVYRGADAQRTTQVEGILTDTLYAMISPPVWTDQYAGPWAMMATSPADDATPFCTYFPQGANYDWSDHFQLWPSFVYAWRLTGDQEFLNKASQALGGGDLSVRLENDGLENIQNRAPLIALMQSLNP